MKGLLTKYGKLLVDYLGKGIGWVKWGAMRLCHTIAGYRPVLHPNQKLGDSPFGKINYFFVLMMENRSFDHMLGNSEIPGVNGLKGDEFNFYDPTNPNSQKATTSPNAEVVTEPDPPHEFDDVSLQLLGNRTGNYSDPSKILNNGFIASYAASKIHTPANPSTVMRAFTPTTLPVLNTLAKEFAVCDKWFSSLPGPTWPNRFFIHAATSGGLDDSPTNEQTIDSYKFKGFDFEKGTIYDLLDKKKVTWRVYHGDALPQAAAIKGMEDHLVKDNFFREFECFGADVRGKNPEFDACYVFIEPDYGNLDSDTDHDFEGGNSQHSVGDITSGEQLIKDIYETIRKSPIWEQSCLLITYDEHGGFFDHATPEEGVPPGDQDRYSVKKFDFKRLGVRVPTVIVSPYIEKGKVDSTKYDHSSLVATVEKRFDLGTLTERDKSANTFDKLFSLTTPRKDTPTTLPPSYKPAKKMGVMGVAKTPGVAVPRPMDKNTTNFLHLAFRADATMNPEKRDEIYKRVRAINTQGEARKYIAEVQRKIREKKVSCKSEK